MTDVALKDEAPWYTPFLRLVGRSPEQLEVRREFEESLKKVEAQGDVLDDILSDIASINESAKTKSKKNSALHRSLLSMKPPPPPDPE